MYTGMVQAMEQRVNESGDPELRARLAKSKADSATGLEPFLEARREMLEEYERAEAQEQDRRNLFVGGGLKKVRKAGNKVWQISYQRLYSV